MVGINWEKDGKLSPGSNSKSDFEEESNQEGGDIKDNYKGETSDEWQEDHFC